VNDILTTAQALWDAGVSVVPARTDGTKAPLGAWKHYQQHRMDRAAVTNAFQDGWEGLGIITGTISGNLEMLELEGRALDEGVLAQLMELLTAAGLGDVWTRLAGGYLEQTPSGGLHILYRLTDGPAKPNTKLARRPATADELAENPDDKTKVLVETRGEGGFVVVAPSNGGTHPTGKPWVLLAGGPATIASITTEERDALHTVCGLLEEQIPEPEQATLFNQPGNSYPEGGLSPGDDFEARADWAAILGQHGWTYLYSRGGTRYWRRPGKSFGISATTGHADDRERLFVFSSSTLFDQETPYTKLGALAVLEHRGDHTAAARALSAAGYGRPAPEQPRKIAAATMGDPGPAAPTTPPATNPTAATVTEPDTYSSTDDGNALRLVDAHQATIRYCPERASWLAWNGHVWRWDTAGRIQELARGIARSLPDEDKIQKRHRASSLSARGLNAQLVVARSDPRIVAPIATLDANPEDLNTPNGIINLRTGQLRAPTPDALCVRSTNVAPDFTQPAPRWEKFLAQTFAGDAEMATYVQRLIGVSLVGEVIEQILPFGHGTGKNGKSTLFGVIMRLLGIGDDGYALSAPAELLLQTAHQDHPTEIARLTGIRLVVTSELEEGQKFAESKVKLLTGGDPIAARFMRADYFNFIPTHTIWMHANHQPAVRTGGPAFWRRIRLLPFLHVVPPEEQEKGLESRLVNEEGPAILAWAIQGAVDYFRDGIAEPASVLAATQAYEKDQDNIGRFVEEMCVLGAAGAQGMAVKVSDLRAAYETWCRGEGEMPATAKALGTALQRRFGVVAERSRTARYYAGIRLENVSQDEENASHDHEPGGFQQPSQGSAW
jgi:putative DNA primase/helicase